MRGGSRRRQSPASIRHWTNSCIFKIQLMTCACLLIQSRRWSHCGPQRGTEPDSSALLALHSYPSGSTVTRQELAPVLAFQPPNGLWPAVADRAADVSFWASALAVNTLMTLGATPHTVGASLDALVHCRPREASWLVRLRFGSQIKTGKFGSIPECTVGRGSPPR
jgi:hypothetical protein